MKISIANVPTRSLDKTYGFRNMAVVRWAKTVPPQLPQAFLQCAVAKVVRFVERATREAEMVRFVERAACPANNAQRRHPRFRAMKRDTSRFLKGSVAEMVVFVKRAASLRLTAPRFLKGSVAERVVFVERAASLRFINSSIM